MTRVKVKNPALAKMREFRKGDDVEEFLATQYRQVTRALDNQYVESRSYVESESSGVINPLASLYYSTLTVKIRTNGGRVRVGLISDGSEQSISVGSVLGVFSSLPGAEALFPIKRDETVISTFGLRTVTTGTGCRIEVPCSSLSMIDSNLAPGEYTYSAGVIFVTGSGYIRCAKLYAEEIF